MLHVYIYIDRYVYTTKTACVAIYVYTERACVSTYVHIYICIHHTHTHTSTYVYITESACASIFVLQVFLCVFLYVCVHVFRHMHTSTRMHTEHVFLTMNTAILQQRPLPTFTWRERETCIERERDTYRESLIRATQRG